MQEDVQDTAQEVTPEDQLELLKQIHNAEISPVTVMKRLGCTWDDLLRAMYRNGLKVPMIVTADRKLDYAVKE